jgi:hypothetical protein
MAAYVASSTAAAAIAQAVKASGSIVSVEPTDFGSILRRADRPLVIAAPGGIFRRIHVYLTSYKGLTFYTNSREPLPLPADAEVIYAKRIWIPA